MTTSFFAVIKSAARVSAGVNEQFLLSALGKARAAPGLGRDRQPQSPARRGDHQMGEFFRAAKADRHFSNRFVVHMKDDAIFVALEP